MRWSYKTVHYELKKEGLLGSAFLDESEIELSLNEYGKAGWELISVLETQDGLIAIFKQPISIGRTARQVEEEGLESEYVVLQPRSEVAELQPDPRESGKFPRKVEPQIVPVDEYEIIVDELDDEEVVKEKKPSSEGDDIGAIRIE